MTLEEIEETVRTNGSFLTDGNSQVASLYYVDPRRFAASNSALDITSGLTAKVIESTCRWQRQRRATPRRLNMPMTSSRPSDTDIATPSPLNGYSKKQADLVGP